MRYVLGLADRGKTDEGGDFGLNVEKKKEVKPYFKGAI